MAYRAVPGILGQVVVMEVESLGHRQGRHDEAQQDRQPLCARKTAEVFLLRLHRVFTSAKTPYFKYALSSNACVSTPSFLPASSCTLKKRALATAITTRAAPKVQTMVAPVGVSNCTEK
jgi:hypothetical protein